MISEPVLELTYYFNFCILHTAYCLFLLRSLLIIIHKNIDPDVAGYSYDNWETKNGYKGYDKKDVPSR
jgi:hypothetical protein